MNWLIILLLFTVGCSSRIDPKEFKSRDYRIDFDFPHWIQLPEKDADRVYGNSKTGSIIFINSLCKKYTSANLEDVSSNLFGGIVDLEVKEKQNVIYQDREAIDTYAVGKMDGVVVHLKLRTLKRNHCTYDFSLVMPLKTIDQDFNTFKEMLEKKVSFQ